MASVVTPKRGSLIVKVIIDGGLKNLLAPTVPSLTIWSPALMQPSGKSGPAAGVATITLCPGRRTPGTDL